MLSLRLVNEKLLLTQKSLLKLEHTTLSTWKTNFNCGFGPNFGSHSDQIWTVIIYNSCNNNNNKRMWKTLYKLHIENAPNEVRTRTVLLTTASSCSGRLLWLHQANTQFDWWFNTWLCSVPSGLDHSHGNCFMLSEFTQSTIQFNILSTCNINLNTKHKFI